MDLLYIWAFHLGTNNLLNLVKSTFNELVKVTNTLPELVFTVCLLNRIGQQREGDGSK
jgi:hypothetical protein